MTQIQERRLRRTQTLVRLALVGLIASVLPRVGLAVDRFVPGAFPTIQAAINASASGDRVFVAPGTYIGSVDFLGRSIAVIGTDGPAVTTVAIGSLGSVVIIDQASDPLSTRLEGFTVTGGSGQLVGNPPSLAGGAVFVSESSPTIENCVFSGNNATLGGAIFLDLSSAQILNCEFSGNLGSEGGAILAVDSEPRISGSTFTANQAFGRGGAIHLTRCPAEIIDCIFTGNEAARGGALSFADNSDGEITDCLVADNIAFEHGGGISLDQFSDAIISAVSCIGNVAASGGGIGITHFSQAILTDVDIRENTAGEGGGVRIFESCPFLDRVVIRGNSADGSAGGSGEGGGIYMQLRAYTILRNCIIAENSSVLAGGGVFIRWKCEPLFVHTVIADNQAGTEGGAIGLDNYSVPAIWNSILWGNTAPMFPAIALDPESSFDLHFTDIEGGAPGGAILDVDPNFTVDYRLEVCSPVIDQGSTGAPQFPAVDIDGNPRVQGVAPDLGAAETPAGSGICFVRGDVNDDSSIDIGDVTASLGWLFDNVALPCRDAADVDDSGVIDIADPIATLSYLFSNGAPPPPPELSTPAPDPTADTLGCGE